MAYVTRYVRGDWKAICDVCGRQFLASELKKRWDGLMVCNTDWEPRHPQDFVRARIDHQAVPFSRPEPADQFITIGNSSAVVGVAIAGNAQVGSYGSAVGAIPAGTFTP